ncbi:MULTISPECIES: tetratricopeptide repeat protein [Halobacteriovorax]|uniref:Tetratricopeptide repeat protein n=1 Tax=Halobacteriovorax vibrionivorans TaxID=2152716 RepID=A0ABY0II60_9BACT|nr:MULTISPECIES: hypothetical protein [Halobacteriovorax]RZF22641.1 hypothetical protein DAY19_02385 [Halobacteriovorax vibrionivorans]TGD45762.1 hypothetical protein EP118_14715 [Halobacteriovorax sp. Y22]
MKKDFNFKNFLSFIALFFSVAILSTASANVVTPEIHNDFLRVKFFLDKKLVNVTKSSTEVSFSTLDGDVYTQVREGLKNFSSSKYIKRVSYTEPTSGNNVFTITLSLKKNVEVFSFYKNRDRAYYVDFWKDGQVSNKQAAIKTLPKLVKRDTNEAKMSTPKFVKKASTQVKKKPKKKVRKKIVKKAPKKEKEYKDFRYGASFIWNYEPLAPKLKNQIRLDRKTAEYFFPIKNFDYEKSDSQAHMQLTLNLYRKAKWGLMYKSIKLYEKKFPNNYNAYNDYMKANALLRETLEKGDLKPVDTAVSMYTNIVDRTDNYEMRKGLYKYLVTFYRERKDYVKALKYAKRFFSDAKENFDYEELEYMGEFILASLANLNQVDKVKNLINDKTLIKIISKQKLKAYEIYTYLRQNDEEKAIEAFESFEQSTKGEYLGSIYYNAAEAYFRQANYSKAFRIYDTFISKYSFMSESAQARLRMALIADLQDRPKNEVLELYKNAINRAQNQDVSLEARIRYVGLRTIRKNKRSEQDNETRVFLDKGTDKKLNANLERLLWQTRLRSYIVDGKYEEALTFLTALPVAAMKISEKKVFEADGAEIVYGIIKSNFAEGKFARAIRAWEIYKNTYFKKIGADPEIQFIIAKSYINLTLWDGFQKMYEKMLASKKETAHTFPLWVPRKEVKKLDLYKNELQILRNLKLKNYASVDRIIASTQKSYPNFEKITFYKALAHYKKGEYAKAEKEYEKFYASGANANTIDAKDLIDSIEFYLESIYESKKYDKYLKVSQALLKDASEFHVPESVAKGLREQVNYQRVEILFNKNSKWATAEAESFLTEFDKSLYKNRVKFLLGKESLKKNNFTLGEKLLNEILNDKDAKEYLKELVRSELTLINLKKRTL